jgi:hypothetical protein
VFSSGLGRSLHREPRSQRLLLRPRPAAATWTPLRAVSTWTLVLVASSRTSTPELEEARQAVEFQATKRGQPLQVASIANPAPNGSNSDLETICTLTVLRGARGCFSGSETSRSLRYHRIRADPSRHLGIWSSSCSNNTWQRRQVSINAFNAETETAPTIHVHPPGEKKHSLSSWEWQRKRTQQPNQQT